MAGETPPRPRCLWILTQKSIMGITLENLLQLGKEENIYFSWNSVTPLPSDFFDDQLPNTVLNPFLYDSKLFLSCGFPLIYRHDCVSSEIYQVSFQYHSKHNKPIEIFEDSSSLPLPPTKFKDLPHVVNSRGKVYLFGANDSGLKMGMWVLDSPGMKDWRSLHPPPFLRRRGFGAFSTFILRDKLFFYCLSEEQLYVLDTLMGKGKWKKLDHKLGIILRSFTEVSLPLIPQHQVVALSWKLCYVGPLSKQQVRVKFVALLLNISNNSVSVLRYQPLFEPLSSTVIPSPIFDIPRGCVVKFVDLGNNLVCALVTGMLPEEGNSYWKKTVLCVSVFSLTVVAAQESSTSKMKNQRFLDVDVRVDSAFFLPDYCCPSVCKEKEKEKEEEEEEEWNFLDDELDEEAEEEEKKKKKEEEEKEKNRKKYFRGDRLNHAFVFPYMEELPHVHDDAYSKGTESPPRRKLRKLASGT